MSRRRLYKKICRHCKKRFKGISSKKYCSNSCRVLFCREQKKILIIGSIKELLELELSFVSGKEFDKVVATCVYAVKKWMRETCKTI